MASTTENAGEPLTNADMLVYINGEFFRADQARVSVLDHGFMYGDGIFEGTRIDNGAAFRLKEHVDRLYRSAHFLRISIPMSREEMAEALREVVRRNNLRNGYLRTIVSRGEGPPGIDTTREIASPTIVIMPRFRRLYNDEIRTQRGLKAKIVSTRRTPPECVDPRIKATQYINNLLGKFEHWDAGADIGIMLSTDGYVSECCTDNIFCVSGEMLRTPSATRTLDGITRRDVMRLAQGLGMDVAEADLTAYDLYTADEVFVTGTLTELMPIVSIDGRQIGSGTPGPTTLRLLRSLREAIATEGEQIL